MYSDNPIPIKRIILGLSVIVIIFPSRSKSSSSNTNLNYHTRSILFGISCLLIFVLPVKLAFAQLSCPMNYSEREVVCGGAIVKRCVPDNFSCQGCWHIIWPRCNSNQRNADNYANSYEDAINLAQEQKAFFQNASCVTVSTDYNRYSIYLIGGNYCSTLDPNSAIKRELGTKISVLLIRIKDEMINYWRYFNGQPYKPGAIVKEYKTQVLLNRLYRSHNITLVGVAMELSKSRWKTAIRKNELNAINTSELNGMVTDLAVEVKI